MSTRQGQGALELLELWTSVSRPTEHEVTLRMSENEIPREGATFRVPDLGEVSVLTVERFRRGRYEAGPGEVIVRLDVTTPPERYP
jgi:hypothetical protein